MTMLLPRHWSSSISSRSGPTCRSTSGRGGGMSRDRAPIEAQMDAAEIRKAANLIAVLCRNVVQSCLRDEEIAEADREFAGIAEGVIRGLSAYKAGKRP